MDQRLPEPAVTDWRGLCEELVQELERYQSDFPATTDKMAYRAMAADDVLIRARAALAQPEPEVVGPSDEELLQRQMLVPVLLDERMPGPENCDEDGYCWFLTYENGWTTPEDQTFWLPAHALPLPSGELEHG